MIDVDRPPPSADPDVAEALPVMPPEGGARAALGRAAALILGLLLFIVALELLKKGAGGYGREVVGFLRVGGPVASLGLGWLLAYLFLSGSPVAAVAVSLFAAGTLDALQTFTMITGSRLGAALIVLITGAVYAARVRQNTDGLAVGVLAMITTAAIYLPALAIGSWLLGSGLLGELQVSASAPLASLLDWLIDPLVGLLAARLPPWGLLLVGVAALLLAFNLLDRALPSMSGGHGLFQHLDKISRRPLAMFALGAVVTGLTLSVSVSISVLVPLAARGLLRRERVVPYIMGANITTFIDTLVAALLVGGPAAFTIVLVEMVSVAALSLLVLLAAYAPFERGLLRLQERILGDRRALGAFIGVLVVAPLALLLWR
ncbi:hypothetical protein K2Z83_07185 [Oscillochloris sp. ZM17-4]|uniref:hypothetical protein n=1 Tax=Oscillochloris sp. ZM17-4 TaxID=2866714 RepID=UPI001C730BC9|nr:hypothetical protein [Oscillochloris sp. ZM17-4]MBX0327460.1 hypothetical protein [Oscillochloris sp. ZM17-4]